MSKLRDLSPFPLTNSRMDLSLNGLSMKCFHVPGLPWSSANPAAGKSFFSLDIAIKVALGAQWHNRETKQGKVAYICGESPGGFRKRLRAYAHHFRIKLSDLHDSLFIVENMPDLRQATDVAELRAQLRALSPLEARLCRHIVEGSSGSQREHRRGYGVGIQTMRDYPPGNRSAVVLIHHSGKNQDKGSRGWSGMRGHIDTEIEIRAAKRYASAGDFNEAARWQGWTAVWVRTRETSLTGLTRRTASCRAS